MAGIYVKGGVGPWLCEDSNSVACEGWLGSDHALKPGPTCEGVGGPVKRNWPFKDDTSVIEGFIIREDG